MLAFRRRSKTGEELLRNLEVIPAFCYLGGGTLSFFFGTGGFNLLLYEDGVEIRTFFTSFFIPYDRISKAKRRWSHMGSGFSIECDLPDVPNRMDLHFAQPDKPFEAIQERLRLMGRVME